MRWVVLCCSHMTFMHIVTSIAILTPFHDFHTLATLAGVMPLQLHGPRAVQASVLIYCYKRHMVPFLAALPASSVLLLLSSSHASTYTCNQFKPRPPAATFRSSIQVPQFRLACPSFVSRLHLLLFQRCPACTMPPCPHPPAHYKISPFNPSLTPLPSCWPTPYPSPINIC